MQNDALTSSASYYIRWRVDGECGLKKGQDDNLENRGSSHIGAALGAV
jgi:hypothetical protein